MKWLTAVLALLLLGLVTYPTAERLSARLVHRPDSVQAINYLSRGIHEFSAARRAAHRRDRAPAE